MPNFDPSIRINRRRALALGGGVAAGGVLSAASPLAATAASLAPAPRRQHGKLPAEKMQHIIQAEGTVSNGVLSISIAREDMPKVAGPLGVIFRPDFELDGSLDFQPLGDHHAIFNGNTPALRATECNPVIDAIIRNGLKFEAFHQHYIETRPNVWFIHFRGEGHPLTLARAVHNVLKATSVPLPQKMPSHPKTPLNVHRLESILHGSAQVGEEGVVMVTVDRTDKIVIDGIRVSPELNISTDIEFKPTGSSAWAGPDFSMTSSEVMPVTKLMRRQGWFVSCLYNQETNEHPQLYFSHMLKHGDPYQLAREIRRGLNLTAAK